MQQHIEILHVEPSKVHRMCIYSLSEKLGNKPIPLDFSESDAESRVN